MNRPKHVVLLNSGKTDAYEWSKRVLGDQSRISVITERKYAHLYPQQQEVHFVNDIADPSEVRDCFRTLAKMAPVDAVIAPSERSVQSGGYLRSFFNLDGPDFDTSNKLSNKIAMKKCLRRAGILVADFLAAGTWDEVPEVGARLGWPIIVKPALGSGSMNTFRINDIQHFRQLSTSRAVSAIKACSYELIVERFLNVDAEYHSDAVIIDGLVPFHASQRYFDPLLGLTGDWTGSVMLDRDDPIRHQIAELYPRVISAVGLREGVTHMELLRQGDRLFVGEIACRPAGGGIVRAVEMHNGVNLWDCFIRSQVGVPMMLPPVKERARRIANIDFPVKPGTVATISSEEDILASVDRVLEVSMCIPGTAFEDVLNSSSCTGIAFAEVANDDELERLLVELKERFRVSYVGKDNTAGGTDA
jgi:hypothetical protein